MKRHPARRFVRLRSAAHPYPGISDYALIGDCHTAALISRAGSVDWCCLPRFDSDSCFGRLLDWGNGGYFQISPAGRWSSRREYLEKSLVLVTTFRELREGKTERGDAMERLSSVMSTAEAVSVAHAVGLRGWFLRGEAGTAADIVECLAGTAAKDNHDDLARLRTYLEQHAQRRKGEQWQELYDARHRLPG